MRNAKTNDYWKDVYSDSRRYPNYIKALNFTNCNGFTGKVSLNPGITVICGLNGVGKSSIMSSIKNLLGLSNSSIVTKNKFDGIISAEVILNREERTVTSEAVVRNNCIDESLIRYLDSDQSLDCLKFWEQSNTDEIFDSINENEFTSEQLEDISQLVGKTYSKCVSYESDEEKEYTPVFFKVKQNEVEYNSIQMGIGEHYLFYMYYILNSVKGDSIILIEEPESYISILSQQRIMNYLAKIISEKKVSIIITSHSPYILKMIKNENTKIVINYNGLGIFTPHSNENAEQHLGMDPIITPDHSVITIFVEDYAARIFLDCLLSDEFSIMRKDIDIVSLNGESEITARLKFDDSKYMRHKFIGVYDGDMQERFLNEKIEDCLKWPHLFLPVKECVEKEILSFLIDTDNIDLLSKELGFSTLDFRAELCKRAGEDHHDWLIDICHDLNLTQDKFIKDFYAKWKSINKSQIDNFVNNLNKILFSSPQNEKVADNSQLLVSAAR